MLVDTHCHLNFQAFEENLEAVIARALKAGVKKIIVPGSNLETSQKAVELAEKYEGLYAAIGIHPHHAMQIQNSNLRPDLRSRKFKIQNELKNLAKSDKVVAIGECGLDYYEYKKSKYSETKITPEVKRAQKELFQLHLELAQELNLPLIIHNRQAHGDILEILSDASRQSLTTKGVFHCISGNKAYLKKVLELGFFIGVDGNVTYSQSLQSLVKNIPLERLLLETDSPYLTPIPLRGTKNEPKNVKIVARYLAKRFNLPLKKIEKVTSENAHQLFQL